MCVWFFDGLLRNMFTYSNEVCNLIWRTKDQTFVWLEYQMCGSSMCICVTNDDSMQNNMVYITQEIQSFWKEYFYILFWKILILKKHNSANVWFQQ